MYAVSENFGIGIKRNRFSGTHQTRNVCERDTCTRARDLYSDREHRVACEAQSGGPAADLAVAFHELFDDQAGSDNTRSTTVYLTKRGKVEMVQVAGWVARRVENWLKAGQAVVQGEHMGVIHMGSQVRVTVPSSSKILVKPGDKVAGGLTPIARWAGRG